MCHAVTGATVSYSHGLASLAGVLISAGLAEDEIDLVTIRSNDVQHWTEEILAKNPSMVLVSAMSNQWELVRELSLTLKRESPRIPLCIGGAHAIASPSSLVDSAFDVVVSGEGEGVVVPLVTGGPTDIRSVTSRYHSMDWRQNFIRDLDELPFPYLDIFEISDILEYPSVMFSRGCPYKCTYCMSRKGGFSGNVRWKSPERAICEVLQLLNYARPDEIFIDDDTLLKNPTWVERFCQLYSESVEVPFYCNARPETVSSKVVEFLRAANCAAIGIGIESGSSRLRRDVLQREMSDEKILNAFSIAHKAGLKTWSFNMVGIPGETAEDLKLTIELNDRAETEFVRVSIFTPYPGTPIFEAFHTEPDYRGYIRSPKDLPTALLAPYNDWLARLRLEGRLWFTESEADLLVEPETGLTREAMQSDG